MTKFILPTALLLVIVGVASAQEKSVQQQVAEALMPLPDDLRAGATVIRYDSAGNKFVLREGTNHMVCSADSPSEGFSVRCYPKALQGFRDKLEELADATEDEFRDIVSAEITQGKLSVPDRAVSYAIRGAELENALPLTVVYLPGATAESTGLTTTPSHYRPWLMFAGTPAAHIMIPGK